MRLTPKNQPISVLLDFDGTITTRDIGDQVIINFAEPGWEHALNRYRSGEINVRELWFYEISLLRKQHESEAVRQSVETAVIREGFSELVTHCKTHEIPIEIVSSGLHFYVDAILKANGFGDLACTRPIVDYDAKGRGVMVMPDGIQDCGMTAMCKCDRVWRMRRSGHQVIFVGDGASDKCVASQADVVLATGSLSEICRSQGIDHTNFETFYGVLNVVRGLS
jgi:2,3-diketo-5-methylthio-1-phosphopentane phosphatase